MSERRWLLVGNPENRRVGLFREALLRRGAAPPVVLSHEALLDGALAPLLQQPDDDATVLRLDAWGEHDGVARRLLSRGYDDARALGVEAVPEEALDDGRPAFGEVLAPTQLHLGAARYLGDIAAVLDERPGWHVLQPPREVLACFDKRATHERLARAGAPVADALPPVHDVAELRAAMRSAGMRAAFVKHRYSSSASCLALFHAPSGHVQTTLHIDGERRFNSLRVRREEGARAEAVLAFLLREGAHVEGVVPKARLHGAAFDLRVLVVAGEASFVVVRHSRHLITNLHLGGWRGDAEALERAMGESAFGDVLATAARAAAAFELFHAGVDVVVEPGLERHRVLEVNAFGDLLPGLTRGGLDVYEHEIEAARRGLRAKAPA